MLEGEDTYQGLETLKEMAEEAGIKIDQYREVKEIEFVQEREKMFGKLITDGAPEMEEIEEQFKTTMKRPIRLFQKLR